MRLTKHHGLGNDFLVLLDPNGRHQLGPEQARALCDRHRGVGADGVIHLGPGARMVLRNADGGEAEVSGNGLRCLGQALAHAAGHAESDAEVETAAGVRRIEVRPGPDPRTASVSVDMGRPGPGPEVPAGAPGKAVGVGLGNPHVVVLVDDPGVVDLAGDGRRLAEAVPGGANVEFIAPTPGERDALTLAVWERGVGATLACGSGACAAAVAARDWGLVGDAVVVHMPGGDVAVRMGDDGVSLEGPATFVATVDVPEEAEAATWH